MYDEAGLGYLSDGTSKQLARSERYRCEAGDCDALAFREQCRTVDGLVEAGEARWLLSAGNLTVTSNARMIKHVAV